MKTFKKILAGIALTVLATGILTLIGGVLFDEWLWGLTIVIGVAAVILVMCAIGSIYWLIDYLNK